MQTEPCFKSHSRFILSIIQPRHLHVPSWNSLSFKFQVYGYKYFKLVCLYLGLENMLRSPAVPKIADYTHVCLRQVLTQVYSSHVWSEVHHAHQLPGQGSPCLISWKLQIGLKREPFINSIIMTKTPDQLFKLLYYHLQLLQTYTLIWKQSLPKCNLGIAQGKSMRTEIVWIIETITWIQAS